MLYYINILICHNKYMSKEMKTGNGKYNFRGGDICFLTNCIQNLSKSVHLGGDITKKCMMKLRI